MKKLFIFFLAVPLFSQAQKASSPAYENETDGVNLELYTNWTDILTKAKLEKKFILLDCYTTSCVPCRLVAKNIFTQKDVGTFINEHFITVPVQMDRTPDDARDIIDQHAFADSIRRALDVSKYPTYLFFSPDGNVIHRISTRIADKKEFIDRTEDALDTTKQYYTILNQWETHKKDVLFLKDALQLSLAEGDNSQSVAIGNAYLDLQKDLLTRDNIQLIVKLNLIHSSNDKWFQLFLNNKQKINDSSDLIDGKKMFVEWILRPIISAEEIEPLYHNDNPIIWKEVVNKLNSKYPTLGNELMDLIEWDFKVHISHEIKAILNAEISLSPEWEVIRQSLEKKYPDYDFGQLLLQREAWYYGRKENWELCAKAAYTLMEKYGAQINDYDMNDIVWQYVFLHCEDRKIIAEAVKWINQIIQKKGGYKEDNLDTYANLLYKLGKRKEALYWERKAIQTAIESHAAIQDLNTCQSNLEKMRKGAPTWIANT